MTNHSGRTTDWCLSDPPSDAGRLTSALRRPSQQIGHLLFERVVDGGLALIRLIGFGRSSLLAGAGITRRRGHRRIAARCLIGRSRRACLSAGCAYLARRLAERRFKPLGHIGEALIPGGCSFTAAWGD